MAEIKLTIRRTFPRLPEEVVAAFREIPTGWAVDAQQRRGALDCSIRHLCGPARIAGAALTVQSAARDNLAPYAALPYAQPSDVLVIATGNYLGGSVAGDILAGMARNAGIAAIVTDGLVRDIEGLRQVGLPIFARGLSPNSPGKTGPGSVGLPVSIGGEVVGPGDLVLADEDGVVVVPRVRAETVLAAIEAVRAKEARMEAAVRAGARAPDWLDEVLEGDEVRFLD